LAGADFFGAKNQFVALARTEIQGDFDLSVRIDSQDKTHEWAQAGILIANQATDAHTLFGAFSCQAASTGLVPAPLATVGSRLRAAGASADAAGRRHLGNRAAPPLLNEPRRM
jgi:hypothetical protein